MLLLFGRVADVDSHGTLASLSWFGVPKWCVVLESSANDFELGGENRLHMHFFKKLSLLRVCLHVPSSQVVRKL